MKYHPAQHNTELRNKISDAFRVRMEDKGVLPKNPWKCKKTEEWLARLGARMNPFSKYYRSSRPVETAKFLNFIVECEPSINKIRTQGGIVVGPRECVSMRIEIPWDLADQFLEECAS